MKTFLSAWLIVSACGGAAWGFAGTPEGQNLGNGWMDTLSLPTLGSTDIQPYRLYETSKGVGPNHMRESRCFIRRDGDTQEWNYGNGTLPSGGGFSGSFVGSLDGTLDTGGLNFLITDPAGGPQLSSEQRWKITAGFHGPRVTMTEFVSNTSPLKRVFSSYHYFASQVDGVINNNVFSARDPGRLFITGPKSIMDISAFTTNRGATATLVGTYVSTDGSARAMMFDDAADDFVGETFVGDPTGTVQIIYQWQITLDPGESASFGYEFGFVPAPSGAAGLLAFAGLGALRRRR